MKLLASLTNRIFLASALLAVLAIGAATYLVSDRVTRAAEAELRRGLIEAGQLLDEHRRTLSQSFTLIAEMIADLPKLKAAIDTEDPTTVQPIAADYCSRANADLLVVADRAGRVLAAVGVDPLAGSAIPWQPAIREALAGERSTLLWPHPEGILHVVTVPVTLGGAPPATAPGRSERREAELLGALSLGFVLDAGLAKQFKGITDSEIAFAIGGEIRATTLADPLRPRLAMLLKQREGRVALDGHDYVALVRPMDPGHAVGMGPGGSKRPAAILLRSRTERLQFLRDVHTVLVATALLAVLVATGVSYAVSRTITRPLAAITSAMRDLAATGDLTRRIEIPAHNWGDEDARLLAATFNTLTESIARFQREAADRERLSSLGRLSTVVAHEIRNPLMIIKASLRTLSHRAGTPGSESEAREAIADIDEQVRRLNRIVNEVLDYARPIAFEWAPADVNAICRDAAAEVFGRVDRRHPDAVPAADEAPRIQVRLDPAIPSFVTDASRLHTALTNLLINARHAVEAKGAESGASAGSVPPCALTTSLEGSQEAPLMTIAIRDHGIGVNPEHLDRVFDPYFTTKRTGTGIGLAISRNIIEGMGGAIVLTSDSGAGTEVRVTLPIREPQPLPASPDASAR